MSWRSFYQKKKKNFGSLSLLHRFSLFNCTLLFVRFNDGLTVNLGSSFIDTGMSMVVVGSVLRHVPNIRIISASCERGLDGSSSERYLKLPRVVKHCPSILFSSSSSSFK